MPLTIPTLRRICAVACAVALASVTLAACGSSSSKSSSSTAGSSSSPPTSTGSGSGSSSTSSASTTMSSSGGGASQLALTANESGGLSFDKKALTAKAGTVTITMTNPSGDQLPHAIAVEGNGVDKDGPHAQPGSTSSVTVKLKPGTYTFYCPVDGHKQAGMKGTLTVQ